MKKNNKLGRALLRIFTILNLTCTSVLGFLIAFGMNLDVFRTNSIEETRAFYDHGEHPVIINLFDYYNAEDRVTFSVATPSPWIDGMEEEDIFSDKENKIASYRMEILSALETAYSIKNNNFQLKITDTIENSVLIDTFGVGEYEPLTTSNYLDYEIIMGLQSPLGVNDGYPALVRTYELLQSFAEILPLIFVAFGVLSLLSLWFLLKFTVISSKQEGFYSFCSKKLPTDFLVIFFVSSAAIIITSGTSAFASYFYQSALGIEQITMQILNITSFLFAWLVTMFLEICAIKVRNKTFFEHTLLWIFCKGTIVFMKKIPIIWRTAVIGTIICAINGLLGMLSMHHIFYWLIFALYNFALLVFFCGISWQMKLLQHGAQSLVNGNFQDKIETKKMYFDCKIYADTLNLIGDSIGLAVEEKIRSQRFKTELITNVSHDIKTPLTSIVTCVELLQKEHSEEEHKEHLELLKRQSMRMKKMVEDLVEASKATTGNLSVNMVETDLVEAVQQAIGEYEDKFSLKNLKIVASYDENCMVQSDGKHLWRVLENLLSNIDKYAQADTRIYVSIEKLDETISISFKNISAEPLNVNPDELVERFVRGDQSRNTEGSGLGLNIAQSLMQVLGGRLELDIDGDLFKVKLVFVRRTQA